MKILGIVAEYNPFHKGHQYHLDTAKAQVEPDYTVAVMSGNFTQRGEPACFSKYTRAQMALAAGIDAVYELPVYYATSGADAFCDAAVLTLASLRVTHIAFGAECDDITLLKQIAACMSSESEALKDRLRTFLADGDSYAKAYAKCLSELLSADTVEQVLNQPNNMLAVCYLKAIEKYCPHIEPVLIPRKGTGYHETSLCTDYPSARSLRFTMQQKEDVQAALPKAVLQFLPYSEQTGAVNMLTTADISDLFSYACLYNLQEAAPDILDLQEDLVNRLRKQPYLFSDYNGLLDALHTRQYTASRISRAMLHMILHIRDSVFRAAKADNYLYYVRLLGFRTQAAPLIKYQKEGCSLPYIQKVSEADAMLSDAAAAQALWQADLFAADCYRMLWHKKFGEELLSDYQQNAVILP